MPKPNHDSRNLQGRVVVVIGASRGAGRAVAAVLGEHRATVYVIGAAYVGSPPRITCLARLRIQPKKSLGAVETAFPCVAITQMNLR